MSDNLQTPPVSQMPALVTGSSRGIGAAIAERLAVRGHPVAISYRSRREEAEVLAARITAGGGHGVAVGGDVGDPDAVAALFEKVRGELGSPAVLINNAGIHRGAPVHRLAVEDWAEVLQTNLTGAFHCCREAVAGMRQLGYGRIVNIGSVIGLRGFPGDAAYASAKAGLLGLTRALAVELAGNGISVNAVLPGFIETDMTAGLSQRVRERIDQSIPMGRQGCTAEVAEVVERLVSGPSYVTGAEIVVDGAFSMR